jgi:hypothetical protein
VQGAFRLIDVRHGEVPRRLFRVSCGRLPYRPRGRRSP